MKTKCFRRYLEQRVKKEEIAKIQKQAQLEIQELKKLQESSEK